MSITLSMEQRSGTSWELTTKYITLERTKRCYLRLASESSKASEDEAESILSLQDKETDFIRDTSDTESHSSNCNADVYDMEFEYEVASLSENEVMEYSTTDSESVMFVAAAAVICDVDLQPRLSETSGVEDTDSSSEEISVIDGGIGICVQCKGINRTPLLKYCKKCFKERRRFLPPRPHRRKRKNPPKSTLKGPVKLDNLRTCLSGLSHESGSKTNQECRGLKLDQIKVPDHLQSKEKLDYNTGGMHLSNEDIKSARHSGDGSNMDSSSIKHQTTDSLKRTRKNSESSLSDFEVKKPKLKSTEEQATTQLASEVGSTSSANFTVTSLSSGSGGLISTPSSSSGIFSGPSTSSYTATDADEENPSVPKVEMCIVCHSVPKDSVFLHQNLAHRCCCYTCAKKITKTTKRCPICNRKVQRVVRLFTA